MPKIELINEPREFEVGELFFSTTDLKGRIQRANDVFERIAAYSWAELSNKPHNIIRHPDMPRIVFQILWDYIQSGRPVVAYVKNLAHDGRYYWVVALVTPAEGGYLSVRFKPTSPIRDKIEHLYKELRAIEAAIEDQSNDRKAAIAASREALGSSLRTLGFADYDEFMRHVLKAEMGSRETRLHFFTRRPAAQEAAARFGEADGSAILFDQLAAMLQTLFGDLDRYVEISQGVREKSAGVADVSESLRVSALNGAIEADKLGAKAAGLRPVLDWLRSLSAEITRQGSLFSASLNELVAEVDLVVFDLTAAKLQIEMTAHFAHELTDNGAAARVASAESMIDGAVAILHASSCETVRRALGLLASIRDRLITLGAAQTRLVHSSHSLRPVYLTGRIEMAEGVGARLSSVFQDVAAQLSETASSLEELGKLLADLSAHLMRGIAHGQQVEATIAEIDSHIGAIY